jgi:mRNA-degrading endonuclease RelE of RelBE toxin-antitoxin system
MPEIILTHKNTRFTKKFAKHFQKLPVHTRSRIEKKLDEILSQERPANIKKLSHYPLAQYRLKIDSFRLFFSPSFDQKTFLFVACISRKDLY